MEESREASRGVSGNAATSGSWVKLHPYHQPFSGDGIKCLAIEAGILGSESSPAKCSLHHIHGTSRWSAQGLVPQ